MLVPTKDGRPPMDRIIDSRNTLNELQMQVSRVKYDVSLHDDKYRNTNLAAEDEQARTEDALLHIDEAVNALEAAYQSLNTLVLRTLSPIRKPLE